MRDVVAEAGGRPAGSLAWPGVRRRLETVQQMLSNYYQQSRQVCEEASHNRSIGASLFPRGNLLSGGLHERNHRDSLG
jgi:hypothetical protein